MSSTSTAVGDVIDERYQLLRLIGEGAMGTVYEAAHTNTGRRVALKLIQQVALGDIGRMARLGMTVGGRMSHLPLVLPEPAGPDGRLSASVFRAARG